MKNVKKDFFRESIELPAKVLDDSIQRGTQLGRDLAPVTGDMVKKSKNYWQTLGPGLTTGASDDDPSGIATYSQAGAQFGFHMLWMAAFTYPMMSLIQEMCGRIGRVTGRGLAGNIRLRFSKKIIYMSSLILFAANTFNIGADLGAMAKAVQLLQPHLDFGLLVTLFAIASFALQIFTPYALYARYLKYLALVLFAYIASAFLAHLDWGHVIRHTTIPTLHFSKSELLMICALLGTTISPYLFFWQSSQEVEEQILEGKTTVEERQGADAGEIKVMRIDVWSGMFLSNLVMFFIIATCGAILFSHGITNITTASQAAEALRPFAGNQTYLLFAIGIIGTGLLAIPVLAGSASYSLAESFRWKEGLNKSLGQAHAFYGVIIIAMLTGLALNFIHLDPIKALIYAAVANGIVAPIVMCLIVLISSDKKVMGHWVNKPYVTMFGWITTGIMALAGIGAIYALIF